MLRSAIIGLCAALWAFAASAQTVPATYPGYNISATYALAPPAYAPIQRENCSWNNTSNASAGVYNFSACDGQITSTLAASSLPLIVTANVPTWVNSTPCLDTLARQQDFTAFQSALWTHIGAGKVGYDEPLNEFQGTTFNTCVNNISTIASLQQQTYAIVKAVDPNVVVLESSVTPGGWSNGSLTLPTNWLYAEDLFLKSCTALLPLACFDALNLHGYVPGVAGAGIATTEAYSPELDTNSIGNFLAVASADGYGSYPFYVDEGYVGSTAGNFSMDTAAQAGAQSRLNILLSSLGARNFDFYEYVNGTSCNCPNTGGSSYPSGLNLTGQALKNTSGWLVGATWTTPMARIKGTNQITAAPNGAGVATGLLAGAGGCAGAPGGTGSLPTGWGYFFPHSSAGMSAYVVAYGADANSVPYIRLRLCGSDTTAGTGTGHFQVFLGASPTASVGQEWTLASDLRLQAGSLVNVEQIPLELGERNSGTPLGSQYFPYPYPTSGALNTQVSEFRVITLQATTNQVRPDQDVQFYYNGTTPLPVDLTFDIGNPDMEQGYTQWSGVLTDSGGTTRCIMWDASNGSSTGTPPSACSTFGYYRDVYNIEHTMTPGSAPLTGSPILIEAAPWKTVFPSL